MGDGIHMWSCEMHSEGPVHASAKPPAPGLWPGGLCTMPGLQVMLGQ